MSESTPARRVLITGGAGFIGGHLSRHLVAAGEHVTVLDDLSTGRLDNVADLDGDGRFTMVVGSVTDEPLLDSLMAQADVVIHLAAAVGVQLVVENPLHTLEVNIGGTEVLLRTAARYGVKTLMASTSEVYGKSPDLPFREDGDVVLGPTSKSRWSYAASKMVDEFLALAYYHQKGLPVVVFRLFNTVGPRQSGQYGMVIPRFVQMALDGRQLTVHGDGTQSRCFLHVVDAVDAIDRLSRDEAAIGEVFNVGSSELVTILELANRVLDKVSPAAPGANGTRHAGRLTYVPYHDVYGAGFEDMRSRQPDTTKVRAATGWAPTKALDDVLNDVVAERSSRAMA
jgi:UDP-glucose 4-epimerase